MFVVLVVCLIITFVIITMLLLFRPKIVPTLVGEGHFTGEKLADETVGEKKWEIILQSIISAGLVGCIGLLYHSFEAKRAEAEREREVTREATSLQISLLREFFGSYIELHHAYKKVRHKFRARSYQDNGKLYIERRDYEQLMDELEDCQLKIESLRRQSEVRDDLFRGDQGSNSLSNQLKSSEHDLRVILQSSEHDLRVILREYETSFSARRNMCTNEPMLISGPMLAFIEKKKSEKPEQNDDESEQRSNMALARRLITKLIEEKSSNARTKTKMLYW